MNDPINSFTGTVYKIQPITTKNSFQWREVWIGKDEFYKKKDGELVNTLKIVSFKFLGANVSLPDNINLRIGHNVIVDYYLDGRLYKDRPWLSLICNKIMITGFTEGIIEIGAEEGVTAAPAPPQMTPPPKLNLPDDGNDLPF